MKNAVIAILGLVCALLLLHALGAFEFGSLIDREHRSHYATLRARAVNASPKYILGVVYNDGDWAAVEAMRGIVLAVDMVNGDDPGKPYVLVVRSGASAKTLNNAAMQSFADALDTAVVIGAFESVHIPSSRALTQFHALPLVSPVAVVSEHLPVLEPDNFVTVFPPLELWVDAVLDHMEQSGVKNMFILSPQAGTYGDIFCTGLERGSRGRQGFDQVFRLNYQEPLRRQDIERLVRSHAGEQRFDALFFGGTFQDFLEFSALLQDNKITLPVYGSDDLAAPEIAGMARAFDLYLPTAVRKSEHSGFSRLWRERHGTEPGYHARFGAETMFLLAGALREAGAYDPQDLADRLHAALAARQADPARAPEIAMEVFPGGGADVSGHP